jgi:hypothetical protein
VVEDEKGPLGGHYLKGKQQSRRKEYEAVHAGGSQF